MKRVGKFAARFSTILLSIFFVVALALLVATWVVANGPSPTARRLFVAYASETRTVGWLADIYLSETEIEQLLDYAEPEWEDYEE